MVFRQTDIEKLRIMVYPDPVLRQKALPVEDDEFGPELTALAENMIELMVRSYGIGLAAPQVGLSKRIIVISLTGNKEDAKVMVNPELSNFQGTSEMEEGCLSIPNIRAKVKRYATCSLKAQDLEGRKISLEASELEATVLQHETDHLDGTLFIDRLNTVSRMACRRGLQQLEKEYQQ